MVASAREKVVLGASALAQGDKAQGIKAAHSPDTAFIARRLQSEFLTINCFL